MSTPAQIAANRENAQLSTGPQSAAGKAKVSRNAQRHAATARRVVILDGEEEEYNRVLAGLRLDFQPEGEFEEQLFQQILVGAWNLRRCQLNEIELQQQTPDCNDPLLVEGLEKRMQLLLLYAQRAERSMYKATQELRRIQSERHFRTEAADKLPFAGDSIHDHSILVDHRGIAPAIQRGAHLEASTQAAAAAAAFDHRMEQQSVALREAVKKAMEKSNPFAKHAAA
jgi:hypothetical protein